MRYLPHTPEDISRMLHTVGARELDALFEGIPEDCCCRTGMQLPAPLDEWALNEHMDRLAGTVSVFPEFKIFIGAGSYDHFVPASVGYLMNRSEFVTSYTPYQPEISQGTLQGIYEYQTLACKLMGTDVATASHYDGATALAEAMLMAVRISRKRKVAVSRLIHPHYRQVVRAYLDPTDCTIIELPYLENGRTDLTGIDEIEDLAGAAVQSPNFFGIIENISEAADRIKKTGALSIVSFTEALAYGLLKSPGSLGADIVCGEGQSLGLGHSFGGPGLGMLGSRNAFVRNLPGRLVGKTVDREGKRGFVLTLATREQHIRRERATSNICTNNSLCALTAAAFMASLGGTGIRDLARLNHDKAEYLKETLQTAGFPAIFDSPTFNEFVVRFPAGFNQTHRRLAGQKILAGLPLECWYPELKDGYLLCATETAKKQDMDELVREVQS